MEKWYEILINGYSWFTNEANYHPAIKIAETPFGELTEGRYTRTEIEQMKRQLRNYETLGYNQNLEHLNRTGITVK